MGIGRLLATHNLRTGGPSLNIFAKPASILIAFCLHASALPAFGAQGAKPRVLILTTGGTIAGQADPRSAIGYNAGALGAQQLIAAAPGIDKLAQVTSEKVAAIASQNMTDEVLFALARRIGELFAKNEAEGVVITHGTDTMEETAFFLDLVLPRGRPVVLVGSMRPATALGADGPANLYNAVEIAASPEACDRGVLITLNNTIHSARGAQKTHTTSLETLRSPNWGPLGYVNAAGVRFNGAPPAAVEHVTYKLPASHPLPRVEIIYAHEEMDGLAITDALARGARGLVLAGLGDGNASSAVMEALHQAAQRGIVVVRSSHVGSGFVERNVENDDDTLGFVASLDLSPQKARMLVRVLIANGVTEPEAVQRAFESSGVGVR
jgi:L-asparaginase